MESSGSGARATRATAVKTGGGPPHLSWSHDGEQHRFALEGTERLTIGRGADVDLALDFDPTVSQLHAELERIGRHWVVYDDGLSRHGSFLNGEPVHGRRRLENGDELRLGSTTLTFRQAAPAETIPAPTAAASAENRPARLTETQREVLIALARPFAGGSSYAVPATNRQVAEEAHLSVDSVKRHLRQLFERFGIGSLAQNEKRVRLVELALQSGLISIRDLEQRDR